MENAPIPFIKSVYIKNYKSIGHCALELEPFTVLVGRNGAGKSNFLDALRFISDSLDTSLDHAIKWRGGIDLVRRRSTGHPRNFSIGIFVHITKEKFAKYSFEVGAKSGGAFVVKKERLEILRPNFDLTDLYQVESGQVTKMSLSEYPEAQADRLYLVAASGLREFREVYDALRSVGFYNLNPQAMLELQSPDAGNILMRDGSNIASVVGRLQQDNPEAVARIGQYLGKITPGVEGLERVSLGPRETIQFRQKVVGAEHPWRFYAANMSDGTLRATGVLVAVSQLVGHASAVRLVGIEEPETALHPAAANALVDAIREANATTQVIVTSHSPDILDVAGLDPKALVLAVSRENETRLGRPDGATLEAIRTHLYSAGDLHRMDQLILDEKSVEMQNQLSLFE
ncbi:MAG: AAA family ATPase [Phycisphaerales bacterium]|nr:AAA family ATPase [Phycisphaerales bacterium]